MNISILAAALIIGIGAAVPPASLSSAAASGPAGSAVRQDPDVIERAKRVVSHLRADEFEQATATWDSTMAVQLPAAKLADAWKQLTAQVGAFSAAGTPTVVEQGAIRVVLVPLTFEHAELVAQIAYNSENKVTGLFFVPKA